MITTPDDLRQEAYNEARHEIARLEVAHNAIATGAANWLKLGELATSTKLHAVLDALGSIIVEKREQLAALAAGAL